MSREDGPLVVLGLGNVLLGDDGIGVRVVEALTRLAQRDPDALPHATRLLDGGTLGLGLMDFLDGARALLLVDAMDLGQPPGTISLARGDAIAANAGRGGPSSGGVGALLATARLMGMLPPVVAFLGVQVGEIRVGSTLSPDVRAALPAAVDAACRALRVLDPIAMTGRSRRIVERAGATA